jgi:hypothetical protein
MSRILGILVFVCLIFNGLNALAQEDVTIDCSREAVIYSKAFIQHFQLKQYDLAEDVLYQWEQECALSEPIQRARLLLLIQNNRLSQQTEPPFLFEAAVAYANRQDLIDHENPAVRDLHYADNIHYYGYIIPDGDFDRFTRKLAEQLLTQQGQNNLAVSFLHLYSGNSTEFFLQLKQGSFPQTELSKDYHQKVKMLKRMPEFNFGLGTGLWIPGGNLAVLGIKPMVNIYAGMKFQNTTFNIIADIRFGKSKELFEMDIKDTLIQTRNHQGAFFGLQLSRILLRTASIHYGILASAGIDVIDIVEDRQYAQRQMHTSWGFQTGVFAEYIFANRSRLTLTPGYHFINHQNNRGTAMDGNAFILRITYGLSENARRNQNLARLGY